MSAKFFGQFLLERGRIGRDQLLAAVKLQDTVNLKVGTIAVDRGFMTATQVEEINLLQRTIDKRFGELAIEKGLLTEAQLGELLSAQKADRLMLGEALVKTGVLSSRELGEELEAFRKDQTDAPGTLPEVYNGRPNARVLEVCAETTCRMFLRMLHAFVKPASCHGDVSVLAPYDVVVAQEFTGGFNGAVALGLQTGNLREIAAKLMQLPEAELSEADAHDCGAEFLNIVCGNLAARLSAMGLSSELQAPVVLTKTAARHERLAGLARGGPITVTPLLAPDGAVELCVFDRSSAAR
ncbi:MAG: chemotaxis protein CheX [Deltaproteobacteria bacterium]|nr:chemotaxis protein CheX [Deltaproteobacteria bacterium]